METDRELLKLAAKAAGMMWIDDRSSGLTIQRIKGEDVYNFGWNPLTDDGDALRLAVKLQMDTFQRGAWEEVEVVAPMTKVCSQLWGDDPYAATRRAIVCAAAEIGRATP